MEKIAIIGLTCLLPDAKSPEDFWQNLIAGKDSKSLSITIEELGVDPKTFYDQVKGKVDKFYCLQGGYIRDFNFEPSEYNLPLNFLESLDNTFKWSLHAAKQAIQQSGYLGNESVLSKCGVVLGNLSTPTKFSHQFFNSIYNQPTELLIKKLLQQEDFHLPPLPTKAKPSPYNGLISSFPAALIARTFSLSSNYFCLDAACSSSFYAIKLASHYLWSHKADLMLAGAVSCAEPMTIRMGFSAIQAYPENGTSCPFDKSSRGIITADGIGMVVLKRYSDAIRDGDKILATICGNGLSNDGRGKHLLSPNSKGQTLAFERAYNEAQISPKAIDYLECHATGTLLGDTTELNSIETFFGQHQATPLLGAAKANVGHLLSAAGMVSLTKVILSMSHDIIPPTINITEPLSSENGVIPAEQFVRTATAWPNKSPIKCAAISAFGFGGSNSHLILEQGGTPESMNSFGSKSPEPVHLIKTAIVGMDAFFGGCDGLDAFEYSIYNGIQHFIPLPPDRWQGIEAQENLLKEYKFADASAPTGAYIKDFEIDTIACKIPPNEVEKLNPQHILMLKVANRAIQDAGLKEGGNVAVIIAADTELSAHGMCQRWYLPWQLEEGLLAKKISLSAEQIAQLETLVKDRIAKPAESTRSLSYTSNIMGSRISALWNFNGPSFTVTAGENSAFKALEVAQMLLSTAEVDAVVVGAVDLAGGLENVWLQNQFAKINTGVNTLSYDQLCNGWSVGEGAGAVVLSRYDIAKQNGDRIYAVIDAISFTHQNSIQSKLNNDLPIPNAKAVNQACQQAFNIAGIQPTDVNYLEVFGSGIPQQDEAEIIGLLQAYSNGGNGLNCALGSVKANIGHTFAASGIASLIKTALCLYHRYIPATPKWSGVKKPEDWQGSPFYVAPESRAWPLSEAATRRVATINGMGVDGTCTHLILSEEPGQKGHNSKFLQQKPFYLFPLAADDRSELLEQIRDLQETVENCSSLSAAASLTFATFKQCQEAKYAIAILGHDKKELAREIGSAWKGVNNAFEHGEDWKTPLGSYFTAKPLGEKGAIAYVYPSAASSFLGIGRDLLRLFPRLYERDDSSIKNLNSLFTNIDKLLYPRSLNKLSTKQLEALEKQFLENSVTLFETEITIASIYTLVMRDILQVQPNFVFGYSMGEISMMIAQGVWSNLQHGINALSSSPLFTNKLSGPKNAVREHWGLPITTVLSNKAFWSTYVLRATPPQVRECIKHENRVYLTQINTPEEVLIAGDTQVCQRVIKTLGCDALSVSLGFVMHCEAMHSEYDELVNLNTYPVENIPRDIVFYSASEYAPIAIESRTTAHSTAKVLCKQVDFPRLVNQVYKDGARIFIELGAGNSCSRWIDKILNPKEHITVAFNRRGMDDHTSIIKALATLLSHRVSLDLSSLYSQSKEIFTPVKSMTKTITLGGPRIFDTVLTEENRKLFKNTSGHLMQQADDDLTVNTQQSCNTPEMYQAMSASSFDRTANKPNSLEQYSPLIHQNSRIHKSHATFLKTRQESIQQISEIIQLGIACAENLLNHNFLD